MKELKEAVKGLVHKEYERAAERFGEKFNSPHEAYAVILEEKEEADVESENLQYTMDWFWSRVKRDDAEPQKDALKGIEKYAINAACELIQVAAMAYKAGK